VLFRSKINYKNRVSRWSLAHYNMMQRTHSVKLRWRSELLTVALNSTK
jgi:hypothetical protein